VALDDGKFQAGLELTEIAAAAVLVNWPAPKPVFRINSVGAVSP
jgi:hypothetical protein